MHPHHMKKETLRFDHPLDFDPTIAMCQRVHRSRAISAVITPLMEG